MILTELFVMPGRAYQLAMMPYSEYLQTPEWKARRAATIEYAGGSCMFCDSTRRLEAHHRTYQRRGNEEPRDLVALCHECHSRPGLL